jgi:hypothetical protein
MMESFFGSLKTQWIGTGYAMEAQARMGIFKHIEMFRSPTRRHSAVDAFSSREYDRLLVRLERSLRRCPRLFRWRRLNSQAATDASRRGAVSLPTA